MKIKVSVCSEDALYCERLVNYFNSYYYDKFQWDIYTQSAYLQQIFQGDMADIILVGREMKVELQKIDETLREGTLWVYLIKNDDEREADVRYLEKYRRADQIYKDLLDLYSEKMHIRYENIAIVSGKTTFITVVSAGGGIGASTIASAAAKAVSQMEKVLYLNLEILGSCELSFVGDNKPGLDELLYAIKSRRNTLALKIESSVSRDRTGVYYFKECTNPMDLQALSSEDVRELLKTIEALKTYDKVMIDLGNGLSDREIMAMAMSNRIIMVSECSKIAELKLQRYIEYIKTVEEIKKFDIISKMQIYFNRTMKSMQLPEQISQIRVGGSFPLIENGDFTGIIDKISKLELFHNMK